MNKELRIAVFPGSFDPYTVGHHDLILRALELFDEIHIAIGINAAKKYQNSLESRIAFIENLYRNNAKIKVLSFKTLTIDMCHSLNAKFILRGLRSSLDFEYEKNIAQMNYEISDDVETVFLISRPDLSHISSTIVREISSYGKNVEKYIPKV